MNARFLRRSPAVLQLPRMLQTTSYGTGDNAQVLSGNPYTTLRYETRGNLVRDRHARLEYCINSGLIWPGDATAALVPVAAGTWDIAVNYVVGKLVTGIDGGAGLHYIAIDASGPATNPVSPGQDEGWESYWVQTPWMTGAGALVAMTWDVALAAALALDYGGITGWSASNPLGWRLPTTRELECLAVRVASNTYMPSGVLAGLNWIASTSILWTSVPHSATAALHWQPSVDTIYNTAFTTPRYAFPVRSLY